MRQRGHTKACAGSKRSMREVCSFEEPTLQHCLYVIVFASAVYNDADYNGLCNLSAINTQRTISYVTWYSNGSEEAANTLAELNISFKNRSMFVLSGIDKEDFSS